MTRNQLPEGVGKKIVEALKRQAEADITPVSANENTIGNNIPLTEIQDLPEVSFEPLVEDADSSENLIIEEELIENPPIGVYKNKEEINKTQDISFNEMPAQTFTNLNQPIQNKEKMIGTTTQTNIPANVAVLKNLISSLPVGVTKQTGAQIIRQTLEAMGIPMNNVLKEAQEVQEELNSSTRECMLRIQEYKTNILQLEQSVQDYQRSISQINDLISLFLLTDRK